MTCSIRCELAQTFAAVAFAAVEVRTGLCRSATRGHSGPPSRLRSSQPPGSNDRGWVSSCRAKKMRRPTGVCPTQQTTGKMLECSAQSGVRRIEIVDEPMMAPSQKEQPMRRALLACLLAASPLVAASPTAFAETACEARCQGHGTCLKRCAEGAKRRLHVRQQPVAPYPSNDANDRVNDWRERAFRIEGGAGGSGGSM